MTLGFEWGLGRGRGPAPVWPDSDSVGLVRSESHAFVGRDPVRLAALPALTLSARRAGDPAACEPMWGTDSNVASLTAGASGTNGVLTRTARD